MKKPAAGIGMVFLVVLTAALAGGEGEKGPLSLSPIANAGVLVACGGQKVLIDALFDKPNPVYRAPGAELLEKMKKGEPPFDGVDLILVTHNHSDHFSPGLALQYLQARPEATLVAPSDAVTEMRKLSTDWAKVEPRVVALDLKLGEKTGLNIEGIPLTAFRTLHGDRDTPMNLMYLFEVGGRRVFHEGDSNTNSREWWCFGLGGAPIDLALVHYWMPFVPEQVDLLREVLAPTHVALIHLPIKDEAGEWPARVERVKPFFNDIFLMLPTLPVKVLDE